MPGQASLAASTLCGEQATRWTGRGLYPARLHKQRKRRPTDGLIACTTAHVQAVPPGGIDYTAQLIQPVALVGNSQLGGHGAFPAVDYDGIRRVLGDRIERGLQVLTAVCEA